MGHAARHKQSITQAPGTVAFMAGGLGRHTVSHQCVTALEMPDGTDFWWVNGSCYIASNRNEVANGFKGDWLLMIDDDQVFAPDMLTRLLRHFADDRVDIVAPLILRRGDGYNTVMCVAPETEGGLPRTVVLTDERGLAPVYGVGTGVMLIRRKVFDGIPRPWFRSEPMPSCPNWELDGLGLGDDWAFCAKANKAGFGVFCDLETQAGHLTTIAVWPTRDATGRWRPIFQNASGVISQDVAVKSMADFQDSMMKGPR